MKTQSINPKKLIGIDIAIPDMAAMFAERIDSLSRDNISFPVKTFAVIDIVYNIANFHA